MKHFLRQLHLHFWSVWKSRECQCLLINYGNNEGLLCNCAMWRCSNNILFSVTSKTELLQLHAAQCEQLREMGIIYIHVLFCRLLTLTFVMRSQVRFSSHHSFTLPCWCSLFGLSSQQMCCSSRLLSLTSEVRVIRTAAKEKRGYSYWLCAGRRSE